MRIKFLIWLRHLLKVPEGAVAPKILGLIYKILFPLRAYYEKQSGIRYDPESDVYIINGLQITSGAIEMLKGEGDGILEVKNGQITVLGNFGKDLKSVKNVRR